MTLANTAYPGFLGPNALKWLPSDVLQGVVGNVYYVANAADTAVVNFLNNNYATTYSDGSQSVYTATSTTANVAIQAALDACVANRNDYVIVMPSNTNYGLAAPLTMSKKGVHLICPAGLSGNTSPIGNTARIKQLSANPAIIVSAQCVEIAGFYCKNYADQSFIKLYGSAYSGSAASAGSPNIHHNQFAMVVTSSGTGAAPIIAPYNLTNDDGGAWGVIENNQFISETGTGATIAIAAVAINAQATGCRVNRNEVTIGDGNTATKAISNLAVKGHTDFNTFSESGGIAQTPGGGAITKCVTISNMACAIGNLAAVATTQVLSGGTADESYVENFSALNGGTVATS